MIAPPGFEPRSSPPKGEMKNLTKPKLDYLATTHRKQLPKQRSLRG